MVEMNTIVGFEEGLHARPASVLVGLCKNAKSDIKILKETLVVNPKSILGILTLGASHKDEIKVVVDGEDEVEVLARLKEFFEKNEV